MMAPVSILDLLAGLPGVLSRLNAVRERAELGGEGNTGQAG